MLKTTSIVSAVLRVSSILALCALAALALPQRLAFGSITFADERARKAFEAYQALLERDPAKFALELATVEQLRRSDVEFRLRVGGLQHGILGTLTTDGERVLITLPDQGGPYDATTSRDARLAHELEHARQFDSGELAFAKDRDSGRWYPTRSSYDVGDEVKAWKAELNVATWEDFRREGTASLLLRFSCAATDLDRARVLAGSGYQDVHFGFDRNVTFPASAGVKAGEILRPHPRRPFFGRVYRVC